LSSTSDAPALLAALRGLRTAPVLDPDERQRLRDGLTAALERCQWFTVGVMAPDGNSALACLRNLEQALGWSPLRDEEDGATDPAEGPVFLKGNQRTGGFRIRREAGLGEGLLITGHNAEDPGCEDTWGPLPLDLFA
jgi:hypothetical protein